jgi:multidrug efflux pump subunit AcrA (membrane-fusion protein)
MSVRARLTLDTGRRAVVVPRDAMLKFPDGREVVWVVNPGNGDFTVIETPVVTGVVFDGMVEIVSGLPAGAQIVIRGNETLLNGQRVSPQATTKG